MPINVQHAANASAVLTAAFGAGQGEARRRAEMEALRALEARRAREDQQAFAAKQAAESRDFQREMTGVSQDFQRESDWRNFQQRVGLSELGESYRIDAEGRAADRLAEAREAEREDFEWKLTSQQKADQERYQNALYEIQSSDAYTEEEREEATRRLQAKIAGIAPLPIRKEPSPFPKGKDIGDTWPDGHGGMTVRLPDGGTKRAGDDRSFITHQDKIDASKEARELATVTGAGDSKTLDQELYEWHMKRLLSEDPGPHPAGGDSGPRPWVDSGRENKMPTAQANAPVADLYTRTGIILPKARTRGEKIPEPILDQFMFHYGPASKDAPDYAEKMAAVKEALRASGWGY